MHLFVWQNKSTCFQKLKSSNVFYARARRTMPVAKRPAALRRSYTYTNKANRNLFACLSGMADHALYGMASCAGHTGVTFDAENDRPGPGCLRGNFEAARGRLWRLKALF